MKLAIEIAGQTLEAEFTLTNGGTAQLKHDEQIHTAQVSQPEPGLFIVTLNHRVYRCALDQQPDGSTEVVVNGQRFPIIVRDKKHLRGNVSGAAASGKATLVAPMPGKVVRVLCGVGDEVAAQQGVLVVEAMKMQNEVQAPKAGKVVEIRVSEGQTVNAGEMLAVVE
jgi:biotin carboxyl carrier protein